MKGTGILRDVGIAANVSDKVKWRTESQVEHGGGGRMIGTSVLER